MSQEDVERYLAAQHGMQAGVGIDASRGAQDLTPKHLRVGVNTAMCDHAALVRLLRDKGVISDDEYHKAIADTMEEERARYEERLGSDSLKVKLY